MKNNNEKGAKLLGIKIGEIGGSKVLTRVAFNFEEEITYHLGKVITILYAMKFLVPETEKEILNIKKFYDKHEEAMITLKKILKEKWMEDKLSIY